MKRSTALSGIAVSLNADGSLDSGGNDCLMFDGTRKRFWHHKRISFRSLTPKLTGGNASIDVPVERTVTLVADANADELLMASQSFVELKHHFGRFTTVTV